MTDHIVRLTLVMPAETYERDFQDRIIEGDRASRRFAVMTCDITSEEFWVATAFRVSLPREHVPKTDDIADFLACYARSAIPRYFASLHTIELFRLHDICLLDYFDDGLPELPDNRHDYLTKTECHLSSEVYERLRVQASEYDHAKKAFESAVEKLTYYSAMTPTGLVSYSSDIHRLLRFLDDCFCAAFLGHMSGWYGEKHTTVKSYFRDLMRRKNAAHPNYRREQEAIQHRLYSYSAPKCWLSAPPQAEVSSE